MGELQALEDAEQVILEFIYFVDDAWIEQTIYEEGHKPSARWEIKFDLADVPSPELRKRIRLAHLYYESSDNYPVLSGPTDEPGEFADRFEAWRETDEEEAAKAAETAKAEADAKAEENRKFDEEKATWVSEHGSDRLRLAVTHGYKGNRTYALERAASEFPGFWVDTAGDLEWNDRPDPSASALDLEIQIRKSIEGMDLDDEPDLGIVWLTEAPRAIDERLDELGEQFEPQEAIVISPYLRRYALAMPVDPAHRVSLEIAE